MYCLPAVLLGEKKHACSSEEESNSTQSYQQADFDHLRSHTRMCHLPVRLTQLSAQVSNWSERHAWTRHLNRKQRRFEHN